MHISEGILNAPVLLAGGALAAAGVAAGLKKTDYDKLPQVCLFSAVFFVASLVHVPIGPASAHLVLNGVCGLLLGWAAFPAIFMGLALQAILFQFGGLTTLGINTFNMAFPAVLMGFLCNWGVHGARAGLRAANEFICGAGAVFLSGALTALSLVAAGEAFDVAGGLIMIVHVPAGILEGVLTAVIVEFVRQVRPEMLGVRSF